MGNYSELKDLINNPTSHGLPAWDNGDNRIEGETMKSYLLALVNSLSSGGYLFAGVAKLTPTQTDPGTPDQNVFYIAAEPGTYTNFPISGGYLQVAENEVAVFKYNGQWSKETTGAATAAQVTELGQQFGYYSCTTGSTNASKSLTNNNLPSVTKGIALFVAFSFGNTADNVTLTIGSVTRPLYYNGARASSTNHWKAGERVVVVSSPGDTNFYAFPINAVEQLTEYIGKHDEYFRLLWLSLENKIFNFNGSFSGLQSSATANTAYAYYIGLSSDTNYLKLCYYKDGAWVLTNYKIDNSPELFPAYLSEDYTPRQSLNSSQMVTESLRRFGGKINPDFLKKEQMNINPQGAWGGANNSHIAVYVRGISKVRLVGSSLRGSYYSLLKEYPNPVVVGESPEFCTGTNARYDIGQSATLNIDIPNDCKWLVIASNLAAGPAIPSEIYIYGEESPGAINDNDVSLNATWSSSKISTELQNIQSGDWQLTQLIRAALLQVVKYNKSKNFVNVAYMTDTHANIDTSPGGGHNADASIDAMRRIALSKVTDMNILGGDVITTSDAASYTYDNLIDDILSHLNKFKAIENLVFVKGNHDCGHQKEAGQDNGNISNEQYHMIYQQGNPYDDCVFGTESGAAYFYKDFADKKLRVIVLDSYYDWSGVDNSEYINFGATQENWLYNTALDMSGKSGWNVLIFTHYFGYSDSTIQQNPLSANVTNICKAFQDKGTSYGGYVFSTDIDANLVGVIMGHQHADAYNNSQGFNTIRVDQAFADEAEIGTDNAVCVDVFTVDSTANILYQTRIGRGASHSYEYGSSPHQIN